MEMYSGSLPGISHKRYDIPSRYPLTGILEVHFVMSIQGEPPSTVIDLDGITRFATAACKDDQAISRSQDFFSPADGDIDSLVSPAACPFSPEPRREPETAR